MPDAPSSAKPGGRLRLGLTSGNTADANDPATWGTSALVNIGLWGAVYNRPHRNRTRRAAGVRARRELEASKDATSWTFKLRKGVTFHDGKTLDADDIVASLNHHRGSASKSAAKAIVGTIADVKADGKDRVIVTLQSGSADFPTLCTDYHLVIGAARDGKVNWESCNGTGGYTQVSHEPGIRMVLKRNPNYWKAGRAH